MVSAMLSGTTSPHVTRQVYHRPDDTRYSDMASLKEDARFAKDNHRVIEAPWDTLEFVASSENGEDTYYVKIKGEYIRLNPYALSQVCSVGRMRKLDLPRMDLETRERFMNQLWMDQQMARELDPEKQHASVLVQKEYNGTEYARGITSQSYSRVWDIDLLEPFDRWAIGAGFTPAVPTINTTDGRDIKGSKKPALFRSDRDMYTFFYTGRDNGSQDSFGGLRKGIVIMNSEVGSTSLVIEEFIFREVCANFLIWGMEEYEIRRRRHVGNIDLFVQNFEEELKVYANATEITQEEWDVIERATKIEFAPDKEKAFKRLRRTTELTIQQANRALDLAVTDDVGGGDLSIWSVVNGITGLANEAEFADDSVAISREAGKLMAAAA